MTRPEMWRVVWRVAAKVTPLGLIFGLFLGYLLGEGDVTSVIAGGLIGGLLALELATFEASWGVGLVPRRWRDAPFLTILITRSLTWIVMIVVGIGIPLLTVAQVPVDGLISAETGWSVAATFIFSLLINFTVQVDRLLGRGVLTSLLLGRYHRPREEIRIFLLVDLKGSSRIAEQLGNMRYHAFLKRFIADISTSASRFGAEIHRYVGDEVILTWRQVDGLRNSACVRAVLAMEDQLEVSAPQYLKEFGVKPQIWAGMHLGPVVTGEVGTIKHEIVYLGDTLNVAARIEQACRQYEKGFLVSAPIIEAMELPGEVAAESLGPVDLRGIGSSLELYAISRSA